MITKISLKNIASYKGNPAILETQKRVNLIYGMNGTGKTVFSNFLADKDGNVYSDCSIDGLEEEKILVYNQGFIEKNFYEKDIQQGIFTLSSENKEAEEKIKQAEQKIQDLKSNLENEKEKLTNTEKNIDDLLEESKIKTWVIKLEYSDKDKVLEFCLDGRKGSKDMLFQHIKDLEKPKEKIKKTIEELKSEAISTQGEKAKIYEEDKIKQIEFSFSEIEENNIFSEVIAGNESLQIANLIKRLDNADWVKTGLGYTKKLRSDESRKLANEQCPFCQEQTISNELYEQIEEYFDENYQNKVTELKRLGFEYWTVYQEIESNKEMLLNNDFIKNKEEKFTILYTELIKKLSSNWLKINDKTKHPSVVVELESTRQEIDSLNIFLNEIVTEIRDHNSKVLDKEKTKNEITDNFWKIMRWDYDSVIENFNLEHRKLEEEKKDVMERITHINEKIEEQVQIIRLTSGEFKNITNAIVNINDELRFFGVSGFKIEEEDKNSYRIKRDNEEEFQFKTLSEGEKTIISFLYFLELCKGTENENETITKKIIVIDDPVSSLSHIYIFNIASLIRKNFFSKNNDYTQIFVLTHSLYFFHELLFKYKGSNKKLFRITKNSDNQSNISEMKENEIQNDYQAYWQVLKDHENKKVSDALLANCMRNILEHFFGFINKDSLQDIIQSIDKEEKYIFFIRYVNKESHSDQTTISDTKEINPILFKEAFKKIFENSGYGEHYKKMMSDDSV